MFSQSEPGMTHVMEVELAQADRPSSTDSWISESLTPWTPRRPKLPLLQSPCGLRA
jgi:hypothetical protein